MSKSSNCEPFPNLLRAGKADFKVDQWFIKHAPSSNAEQIFELCTHNTKAKYSFRNTRNQLQKLIQN